MKMKTLVAMVLTFSAFSVLADEVKIPQAILDRHEAVCPDFSEGDREGVLTKEVVSLPGTEFNAGPTLYILGCEVYAYNSLQKAYMADGDYVTEVFVPEISKDGSISATSNLTGTSFDHKTFVLSTSQREGDCGSTATYSYNPYKMQFVLEEAKTCEGSADWVTLYKK